MPAARILPGPAAVAEIPAESSGTASAAVALPVVDCARCWGIGAPTISQAVATAVNHVFNGAFSWLSSLPANPLSGVLEGALLLIRRTVFGLVPTGVSATQIGTTVRIAVNTGSVAYFRSDGTTIDVAGDPGFTGGQQFTATSISRVVTDGTGGCAGFVFTSGTAQSDLIADGIDSLRFSPTAGFTGTVDATLPAGVITIGTAIRGLSGVRFDAAVRLAAATEVDAGTGNASFTGTVDGAGWFGGQSLTVTAEGATTFAADVGGQLPLGALITRAISPLIVEQSADSRTVPLHFMPFTTANGTEVKYGIDVAIGDNPSRRYEFDTGGNGFFSYYTPGYWDGVPLGTEPVDITYTSGAFLSGYATPTTVTIGTGDRTVSTAEPVLVSAVTSASNFFTPGSAQPTNPYANNGPFAGDFGAAFGVQQVGQNPLYQPGSFITSPLFQLPGNLSSGYLVQAGPIGTTPQLTVGITPELRAQFPYAVPVSELTIDNEIAGYYPISGYPLLEQFGIFPEYSVSFGGQTETLGPLPSGRLESLADTGAGSTNVRLPQLPKPFQDPTTGNLTPGAVFTAVFPTTQGRDPLTWQFTAGEIGSVNVVGYANITGEATPNPNVNTGLNLFNDFDVMFDVAERVIWLRPNGGLATVNLESVTTRGQQSYGQNAVLSGTYTTGGGDFSVAGVTTLAGDTVVDAGRGDVTFSGTVDAQTAETQSLTVQSRATTTFTRVVGGVNRLSALTTAGGTTASAGVSTRGAQIFGGDAVLSGSYLTGRGAFTVTGSTTLDQATSVQTGGAQISFAAVDSAAGAGNTLTLSGGPVSFTGAVGAAGPLGGLVLADVTTAIAAGPVTLDGSLPQAAATGLSVGRNVTIDFSRGGSVRSFTGSGVVFEGDSRTSLLRGFVVADNVYNGIQFAGSDYTGTLIAGNTVVGNSAFGIETLAPTQGLTITGNTIGAQGSSNEWGYTTSGPNTHGIVLAAGAYVGTVITGNTIAHNNRSGIAAPDGVQGLTISGNTVELNAGNGIEFFGGDFTGTGITSNTIRDNGSDGISLGAGIGQGAGGGNPLAGYTAAGTGYRDGHYVVQYANNPDFYNPAVTPPDPTVEMTVAGTTLAVNLDTGSRGLYFDIYQLPGVTIGDATPGYVYLNSSNRLFFGQWVTEDITFGKSGWVAPGTSTPDLSRPARATVPVLVVTAIGASLNPPPGSTEPSTTFFTRVSSGTVTITNGTQIQQVAIVPNIGTASSQAGQITIPGGWWANYADNLDSTGAPILGPVSNFGVGFDRTGVGTSPTTNQTNQSYNAFLNVAEMRAGTMRPGYILSAGGVQLGLDRSVSGYAYTDLAPTGLDRGSQTAPDWQPATGRVVYDGTLRDLGPLVIDIGIPTGILTLPGQTPSTPFTPPMPVHLLNSGGAVQYTVNPTDKQNLLTPISVAFFDPLAGAYSQNMPALSSQFFNTGRRLLAGMNYLYDAAGGYLGLYRPTAQENPQAFNAFDSGSGRFTAAYYPDPAIPAGVSSVVIDGNTITGNGGGGVSVNGAGSAGDAILSNVIAANRGGGIVLTNGANRAQPAPVVDSVVLGGTTLTVRGSVSGSGLYNGPFQVQVYLSPATDAGDVQGRALLGTLFAAPGVFIAEFNDVAALPGDWITVTATPLIGALNTSPFSTARAVG